MGYLPCIRLLSSPVRPILKFRYFKKWPRMAQDQKLGPGLCGGSGGERKWPGERQARGWGKEVFGRSNRTGGQVFSVARRSGNLQGDQASASPRGEGCRRGGVLGCEWATWFA